MWELTNVCEECFCRILSISHGTLRNKIHEVNTDRLLHRRGVQIERTGRHRNTGSRHYARRSHSVTPELETMCVEFVSQNADALPHKSKYQLPDACWNDVAKHFNREYGTNVDEQIVVKTMKVQSNLITHRDDVHCTFARFGASFNVACDVVLLWHLLSVTVHVMCLCCDRAEII